MSDPLRVLFVSNHSTLHCGVAEYGRIWAAALRKAGVDVHELDGSYSAIYNRKYYLPGNLPHYDLIHLNWDPAATNHFLPEHFPTTVPLSLFLHDVPPHSTCPLWDRAQLRMAFEPAEGIHQVIDHAVPDLEPQRLTFLRELERDPSKIVIGTAGLRADPGMVMVQDVCARHGWVYNGPWTDRWLSTEEEISRLALSTVNVCWYRTSGRGKSMAAMFCCAARRPLLLSGSSMFSALRPYTTPKYPGTRRL